MVACARPQGDNAVADNGRNEEDASLLPADNIAFADNADEHGGQPWPEAEGYTPLTDIMFAQQGSALVALPPSSMDDDDDNDFHQVSSIGPNTFVADPSVLFGTSMVHDDSDVEQQDDSNRNDEEGGTQTDFRNVAGLALSALEEDYKMTINGQIPTSTQYQQVTTLSLRGAADEGVEPAASTANAQQVEFDVNFANFESLAAKTARQELCIDPIASINADAVKRAVAGIMQNTSGTIGDKFKQWQQQRKNSHADGESKDIPQASTMTQRQQHFQRHSLIPPASLKAFGKDTPKAVQATANLTRAATIAEALERCSSLLHAQECLSIHILGADHVECASQDRIRALLHPLARWIGGNVYSPRHLSVILVGPNVSVEAEAWPPINLLNTTTTSATTPPGWNQPYQRLQSATAKCYHGNYHDRINVPDGQEEEEQTYRCRRRPDVVVCFNAGIWGYDAWKPTIRYLVQLATTTTMICTSYTIQEAEDDFDVILDQVMNGLAAKPSGDGDDEDTKPQIVQERCIWEPQLNPFASKQRRDTATAVEGREYRENAAWQAWRL